MAKKKLKVDGVSFDREAISRFANEADFLEAMNDKTHSVVFQDDPGREAKLKEVWALVQPSGGAVEEESSKKKAKK